MRYATAVGHLRRLAEALAEDARLAEALAEDARLARELGGQTPVVLAAYAFGDLLEGPQRLERSDVALVVDRTADELPWGAEPPAVRGLFERHRLDRVPLRWCCVPRDRPVANHRITGPVRVWSLAGPDEEALDALAARRAEHLRERAPDPDEQARRLAAEAAASLAELDRLVHGHRGDPRAIAEELFDLAAPVWDLPRHRRLGEAVGRRSGADVLAVIDEDPLGEVAQLAGEGLLVALAGPHPEAAELAQRCARTLRERDWEGDTELAEDLEAALGAGPVPARRAVPVDAGEVGAHLDGGGPGEPAWRLELATGELWPVLDDWEASTGEDLPGDWEDPDAWLALDPHGSRYAYRDMVSFAATVADRRLADRLGHALEGSEVFRRFRDVLADRPDEEGRWRVFSAERVRGRGRAWLALEGYRPA